MKSKMPQRRLNLKWMMGVWRGAILNTDVAWCVAKGQYRMRYQNVLHGRCAPFEAFNL